MTPMPQIKHVIYYMLENRSFDNILGWLYEDGAEPEHVIGRQQQPRFHGLWGGNHSNCFDSAPDDPQPVRRGVSQDGVPMFDPHEPFEHVNVQLFGSGIATPVPPDTPLTMQGFLQDFSTALTGTLAPVADMGGLLGTLAKDLCHQITPGEALQILETNSPENPPILNGLARNFAVSDLWFASVPTQTFSNRAFSVCGNSMGFVDNQTTLLGYKPDRFKTPSIWDVLSANGHDLASDWMIYHQTRQLGVYCLTECAFDIPDPDTHLTHADALFTAIEDDALPRFSYLEPAWLRHDLHSNGNSFHPPGENGPGEDYLKRLYDKLTSNRKVWEKTLLIVSFDEHGGTYDHVPPPWGATPPWGDGQPPYDLEQKFGFDRFGVRVQTLFVSPWIKAQTVIRSPTDVPFDHTSIIATILTWMGVPREKWGLGARVDNAPTFEAVINGDTPRQDVPDIRLSPPHAAILRNPPPPEACPITPLQLKVLPLLLQRLHDYKLTSVTLDLAMMRVLEHGHTVDGLIKGIEAEIERVKQG
ncbi:alkaline phosphatase family protein [Niveispirillum sp. KHB5.9]|uniref:alkaline phosphatase family protein n=1 Tax=Niveispirillum sp. KHB5.9 TaxID=3400269 RepID=UPI003A8BB818